MAIQARTEFASALNQVCSERGIEPEVVLASIKQAILAANAKDLMPPAEKGHNEHNHKISALNSMLSVLRKGCAARKL